MSFSKAGSNEMLLTKDANDNHAVDGGDHDDDKKKRRRRTLREMKKMIIINHDSRLCPFQKLPVK